LLKVDPENLMGNYYLAKIYAEMKLFEEAKRWYEKTLTIKPAFESALIDLGVLYEIQKKNNCAIETYRKLIKLSPDRISLRSRIGKIFLREGKYDEASREFEKCIEAG
jgi:Tfp pilus assembly protein PilF